MKPPQKIIKEILARSKKEQNLRLQWDKDLENEDLINQVRKVDADNTLFAKQVVNQYGWPKLSEVGNEVAMSFWLMVQHTPDVEFLKKCLRLMLSNPTDVESQNLARTIDRVRIADGELQYFGTHFTLKENGKYEPLPIEDFENVEQRRKEMGLPSLEEKCKEYNG